jgi:hypothetical protein
MLRETKEWNDQVDATIGLVSLLVYYKQAELLRIDEEGAHPAVGDAQHSARQMHAVLNLCKYPPFE